MSPLTGCTSLWTHTHSCTSILLWRDIKYMFICVALPISLKRIPSEMKEVYRYSASDFHASVTCFNSLKCGLC